MNPNQIQSNFVQDVTLVVVVAGGYERTIPLETGKVNPLWSKNRTSQGNQQIVNERDAQLPQPLLVHRIDFHDEDLSPPDIDPV